MTSPDDRDPPPRIDDFLGEPTRDRVAWKWLWAGNYEFPVRGSATLAGKVGVLIKKLLRPLFRLAGSDSLERQRTFNLILLDDLQALDSRVQDLRSDFTVVTEETRDGIRRLEVRSDDVEGRAGHLEGRTDHLEAFLTEGLEELMRYDDALYSRVDQKLDAYRREARDFVAMFSSGLAARDPTETDAAMSPAVGDWEYQELEKRFRGSGEEIRARLETYLPLLEGRSEVLDLGCGRGEALALLRDAGVGASGVDASAEMVKLCVEQGLEARQADLMSDLVGRPPESLDAIVSFHVIEHFPVDHVGRLVKLAWRALRPGGVVILETPNPLSLTMAANLFWRDPTHVRPIHPDVLRLSLELAGFDEVEIRALHPFPSSERLAEIPLDGLEGPALELADRVNRLRDQLDDALFGNRDYAAIALKAPR
ncbi:MAG: methyltransferase domain-containing protein [Acidobacteriota bacterium]|nr:methyltransferase domain-containing protein [Acidobacteriota bacterium]